MLSRRDRGGPANFAMMGSDTSTASRLGYEALTVADVVAETADTASIVFAVPDGDERWHYRAGQFVTLRVTVGDATHLRSYSMSSSPDLAEPLQVTVKRTQGGVVSNWLLDHLGPGSRIDVSAPAGSFVLDPSAQGDLLAFAAGSGITPIFSLIKTALATTDRSVRLLYANADRSSVIFASALDDLAERHGGRLEVVHHYDVDSGLVDGGEVAAFVGTGKGAEFYLCGPTGFMDTVRATLLWNCFRRQQIHSESFAPAELGTDSRGSVTGTIDVTLGGRRQTVAHRAHATILQSVRSAGIRAPSSCETGSCATCLARLVAGQVEMRANAVLTEAEVAEGLVLTCQAVPVTESTTVVYE